MTKYLAGVLSVIAAGVLLIAYGLLAPQAQAAFATDRGIVASPASAPGMFYAYPPQGVEAYPGQPMPVSSSLSMPVARHVGYVMQPAVHAEAAPARVRTVVRRSRRTTHTLAPSRRDWKKRAMIIGGSSAAAAGLGGLIGGKKGALIGAALGGGASAIYESRSR